MPDEVYAIAEVPRTLSGKVLEVPVKRILTGTPVERAASRDSLANPAALDWFVEPRGNARRFPVGQLAVTCACSSGSVVGASLPPRGSRVIITRSAPPTSGIAAAPFPSRSTINVVDGSIRSPLCTQAS